MRMLEKLAHQNRERIPERPVHAKGWGTHGDYPLIHVGIMELNRNPDNYFADVALAAFAPFQFNL